MRYLPALVFLVACAPDAPSCGRSLCVTDRWSGQLAEGELGLRFTSPLDVNGDGVADVAAGAAFADVAGREDAGVVYVWSGATGTLLLEWEGASEGGLFGHSVAMMPDLDGDGLADVVASAPNQRDGGVVVARSPASGRVLWSVSGEGNLGWDLALAGDHDDDGITDLFVGEPGAGRVLLVTGASGEIIEAYDGPSPTFGMTVSSVADQDGDGLRDPFVGAPFHGGRPSTGAAFLLSSATGATLHELVGDESDARLGDAVASIPDLDGDGLDDLVVGAPYTTAPGGIGQLYVFSSQNGQVLHHVVDSAPGANYGRVVARVHDVDGDGFEDIAIGAPWRRVDGMDRAGYFEIRSGRTMDLISFVDGRQSSAWLGFHIAPADRMIDGTRRGILVSSILSDENGCRSADVRHAASGSSSGFAA